MSRTDSPIVCVVSPSKDAYSETFIKTHVERLPAKTEFVYGGEFPRYYDGGKKLRPSAGKRILYGLFKSVLRLPKDYKQRAALERFLRKKKIAVVVAEYGPTGVEVMDICEKLDIPLVVHFRGYDAYQKKILEKNKDAYPKLFKIASALIAVSHDIEKRLIELGAPPEKVHYNNSGADVALFSGTDPSANPPTFVTVGRLVDKKAPHLILLSFKLALEKAPEARLIVVGDGPLLESSSQLARAFGIADKVEFCGRKSHEEVAAILKKSRGLLQHSVTPGHGDSEGTPKTILEAGAMALPVIATRHGGIKDVIIESETGFLVDEFDATGMANHIVTLAQNPELAKQMGVKARERILSEFSVERSVDRLWSVIKKANEKNQRR